MDSIAVTKPDMGVLSRERLPLSPFGALAQAFAEDLLARAEQEEGRWPFVPLDLLEEGEDPPAPAAGSPRTALQVDLQLVLEVLRREGTPSEQRRATERIVERVLRLQEVRDRSRRDKPPAAQTAGPSMTVLGTLHQEFHQHLTQNIRIAPTLSPGAAPQGRQAPGTLARQAAEFSRQLQTLREEGKAFPPPSPTPSAPAPAPGRAEPIPTPAPDRIRLTEGQAVQALPREDLTLLEEQGDEAARNAAAAQTSALRQAGERLQKLVADALEQERPAPAQGRSSPREETRRTRPETDRPAPAPQREPAQTPRQHPSQTAAEPPSAATADAPRTLGGQTGPSSPSARKTAEPKLEHSPRPAPTAARDIRMGRDTGPIDTITPTAAPVAQAQGQALPGHPPVELSLKAEQEPAGENAAAGRQAAPSAGTPTKAGQASAAPEHREVRAVQKPAAAEQEHAPQAVRTTARDIRMGRDAGPIDTITPTAAPATRTQGQALTGQPPVELSLKTEQEPAGENAAAGRQAVPSAGTPAKTGQASATSEHRETRAVQKPAAAEQEHSPRTVQTAARDIRMGRETGHIDTIPPTPAPQAQGQALPTQPPVELSLKTEQEPAGENAAAGRQAVPSADTPAKAGQASAAPEHREARAAQEPAIIEHEHSPRAVRTAARDIRMGRESGPMEAIVPPPAAQVQGQALPGQPPVELSLKTKQEPAGENAAAGRQAVPSAGTPAKAGQASAAPEHRETRAAQEPAVTEQEHSPRAVRTAARDIRMGRESGPMEAIVPPPAAQVQGQALPGQPPVELSLKAEQEPGGEKTTVARQAAPSAGTPAKAGQASAAPEHREARAAQKPAVIEQEYAPQTVRTAAKDIRMGRESGPMETIAPPPAAQVQGQALTGQPPVELSLKAEQAPAGENPAARRQAAPSAGTPTKAGQASAAPEHREIRTAQKPAGTEQEHTPQAVRTTARDIRMGRDAGPIDTITPTPAPQAQGQALPTQPPVELSLKAEEAPAGENPAARRQAAPSAGTPTKAGQASAAPEHREARTAQKPAVTEREHTHRAFHTTARDIRMGRETCPIDTITPTTAAPAAQPQGQVLPTQPPVELSLKAEEAPAGENPAARRQAAPSAGTPTKAGQASAVPEHRDARAAQKPAVTEREHTHRAFHTTARDIRMRSRPLQRPADGSGTRSAVPQAGPRDAAAPEPGTWSPAPAELTLGPQGGPGETVTAGGTFSVGRPGWTEAQPEPVTLTYGPGQQQGAQTPPQETAPSSGYRESEYVRSLPEWARNFLRSSADPQAAKTMGVARDISALQAPPAEEDVQWTAPNYRPPEAPIAYREKKSEASPRAVEEVRISEAEIQRTADRVYRIIEDRIRLERHRLGL